MNSPEDQSNKPKILTKEEFIGRLKLPEQVVIETGGWGTDGGTAYIFFTGDERVDNHEFMDIYQEHFGVSPFKFDKSTEKLYNIEPGENECWWLVEVSKEEEKLQKVQSFLDSLDHNFRSLLRSERQLKIAQAEAARSSKIQSEKIGWRVTIGRLFRRK